MDAPLCRPSPHPFFVYTAEVLAWQLGTPGVRQSASVPTPQQTETRLGRILRARGDRAGIVLLGLGSGELAAALAARLPPAVPLTVVALDPDAARTLRRAGRLDWLAPDSPCQLLADASPQALCHLLYATGFSPESQLVTVNPEPSDPVRARQLALLRRLLTASQPVPPGSPSPAGPEVVPPGPGLTLALLARPGEPELAAFFAAAKGLAQAAVIVWDADAVPPAAGQADLLEAPVRHVARRLDRDFAAQRNAMLAACPPGWVLSLDPDERPGPGFAAALARVLATPGLGAAFFPRLTLYPDAGRAKVGHGLWPDWQLRLYRTGPPGAPRYVRPLHERLEGVVGRTVLALDAPILHLNRLVADREAVTGKLAAFSRTSGAVAHHLSADYPTLPLEFFSNLRPATRADRLLLLPETP
ncbi:glycosyltransferase family protein [Solidesulfovibrio sp.]